MTDFNFRGFLTFVELADNPEGKAAFGVSVPGSFFLLSPFPAVSLHHVFFFLLHIHLSLCPSAPPFLLFVAHINFLSLASRSVCAVSFCPSLHFAFFSFPPIFLTVLHISLVLHCTWSKILRFWTEICPSHALLLSE